MNWSFSKSRCILSLTSATLFLSFPVYASDRFEEAPIDYLTTEAHNDITRLQQGIDSDEVELDHDPQFGYLKALDISQDSQVLVFSKTSFQNQRISPCAPRAIYYNDSSYIGTVQRGEVIEVSTTDPTLGTVYYTISQRKSTRPEFIRQDNNCLQCHASTLTRGVPGHIVRSVYSDESGYPILKAGTHITTQYSHLEERWGGWYVTGTHGDARHMGNIIATELDRDAEIDMDAGANRLVLDARVDASKYLTAHSDIVSLMVLEHQSKMHNLLTQANFETRLALYDQAIMDEILERDPNARSESTLRRIANIGNKLMDYMLFVDEAELSSVITGTSSFTSTFSGRGVRNDRGRSLREFDLRTRLFRYPLSYLIYSEQFDTLPEDMRDYVYRRLWEVLSGEEGYAHLDAETRAAIIEILRGTKAGLPDYWNAESF